jgi:trans-aconitate 2-methyltransferase
MQWDPSQYTKFTDERSRPFHELLARVDAARADTPPPAYVVDLGCGPATLTRALADRWPGAQVLGVDSSAEMVAAGQEQAIDGRLRIELADLAAWRPDRPVDVVVANAALHWVPGHVDLLAPFAAGLAGGGVLAFQVPDNFDEPSHTLLRDLRLSPRWRDAVGFGADRGAGVERPERYLRAVADAGLVPDVWQTEYLHVLPGDDAVLEWVKGTALRPVLSLLTDDADRAEFLDAYAAQLRVAYPPSEVGTLFPFRRTFVVGRKP